MAEPIIRPIPVSYTGLHTDDHLIDLQEFGTSLQGLGKLTNSVVDFYLHGRVSDPRLYQVRLFAAPPKDGSVLIDIVGIMCGANLPLYTTLMCDMATDIVIPLVKAIVFKRLKRPDLSEKLVDELTDIY